MQEAAPATVPSPLTPASLATIVVSFTPTSPSQPAPAQLADPAGSAATKAEAAEPANAATPVPAPVQQAKQRAPKPPPLLVPAVAKTKQVAPLDLASSFEGALKHGLGAQSFLVSSSALFAIRMGFLAYVLVIVVWRLAQNPMYLYYLTNWSWVILLVHLMIAAANTRSFMAREIAGATAATAATRPPIFDAMLPWVAAVALTLTTMVSVVFWLMLTSSIKTASGNIERFSLINAHSANLVIIFADLVLSRIQLRPKHALAPAIAIICYMCVVWITHGVTGADFPYPFFPDLSRRGIALVTAAGGVLVGWAMFWPAFLVAKLRDRLLR